MRRPRVEEARGKEGREEDALWKEGGEACQNDNEEDAGL